MEKLPRFIAHIPSKGLADEFMSLLSKSTFKDKIEVKLISSVTPSEEEYSPWGSDTDRVIALVSFWSTSKDVGEFKKRNPNLKWVHSLAAGVDKLVGPELKGAHVTLTNAKGAFSQGIGEFIACQMLYFEKNIANFVKLKQANKWERLTVGNLKEKTLGIIGYGDIGGQCALIANRGFGMRVLGIKTDPSKVEPEYREVCQEVLGFDSIDRVLAESDYVVAALPLVDATRGLFNAGIFKKMKKTAVFMNVGRGQSVVEQDLVSELKAGTIAGAFLDVFEVEPLSKDSELWGLENVFITAHCCDNLEHSYQGTMNVFFSNLETFMAGKPFKHVVDLDKGY